MHRVTIKTDRQGSKSGVFAKLTGPNSAVELNVGAKTVNFSENVARYVSVALLSFDKKFASHVGL